MINGLQMWMPWSLRRKLRQEQADHEDDVRLAADRIREAEERYDDQVRPILERLRRHINLNAQVKMDEFNTASIHVQVMLSHDLARVSQHREDWDCIVSWLRDYIQHEIKRCVFFELQGRRMS